MDFDEILEDRRHGSTYLVRKYLEFVKNQELSHKKVAKYNQQLRNEFGDMAIIASITHELDRSDDPSILAAELLNRIHQLPKKIGDKLHDVLSGDEHFLTFSNSQTVIDVINYLQLDQVSCMESLPGGEGKDMADAVNGTVVSDAHAYENLPDFDIIFLGCDRYASEVFVNKVGTKKLVSKSSTYHLPVFVLTSQFKQVPVISAVEDDMFEIISREDIQLLTD